MKSAVVSFSKEGFLRGEQLVESTIEGFSFQHYPFSDAEESAGNLVKKLWITHDALIFISAAGIATRLSAPLIKSKMEDPAVVCMDDQGKYAIPILSGHLGGANMLAERISSSTGAIAVITTATDNRGIQAPDLFARENDYHISNPENLTKITSLMVNDEPVGFYGECGPVIAYDNIVDLKEEEIAGCNLSGIIIVSSKLIIETPRVPYLLIRPRNINIGIGCRRGVDGDRIIEFIKDTIREEGFSYHSIGKVGTIEVKKDEPGIIQAAEYLGCELSSFSLKEIEKVQDKFPKSEFVKRNVGVYSVSEPVACLLGGKMITNKARREGITLSISREV